MIHSPLWLQLLPFSSVYQPVFFKSSIVIYLMYFRLESQIPLLHVADYATHGCGRV